MFISANPLNDNAPTPKFADRTKAKFFMVKTEVHLVSGKYLLVQEDLESVNNSVALNRPNRKYLLSLTDEDGKRIYANSDNIEFITTYEPKPSL